VGYKKKSEHEINTQEEE